MNKGITKISLLLWVFAIGGFITSTMHYHGDSLHCLEHGHEPHYTENDQLCPVCVVHSSHASVVATAYEVPFVQEDTSFFTYSFFQQKKLTSYKSKRAPPVLA